MTCSALSIRPAHDNDAEPVAAIYCPYVRDTAVSFEIEPPSSSVMAQRIRDTTATHPWLVAELGGKVVGYSYASKHSQRAASLWMVDATIYIDQQTRRSGVGRKLYAALIATLYRQGFRSVLAEIVLPNPGSSRLHEVMGFKPIGIHKDIGFASGTWHDIAYWRLGLTEGAAPPSEPIPFSSQKDTTELTDAPARDLAVTQQLPSSPLR